MKKQGVSILVILTLVFVAFTVGFHAGKNSSPESITVSIPESMLTVPPETTEPVPEESTAEFIIHFPIDINTAGLEELSELPGIGPVLGQRILDYREENGKFTLVEELLNVKGIGQKRFEEILDLITIGG